MLRDELLEREAFDTLLEANGALRKVAAAHQHDPATQCLVGYRPPAPPGVAAPCVRMAYASANARGWSIGGQNPNLEKSVIHGGRSAIENKVHVNDLHATLLHLLGIDHERLTYRHNGRNFRLTDVGGEVIRAVLA